MVQLRHGRAGRTRAKVIHYPTPPDLQPLSSYSRWSYGCALAKDELLYLSAEHLRGADDCLRDHSLCNGSLNDRLESADKDICYCTSGQTASSSSVLVPCVSEFKVTSLMSCYDTSPPEARAGNPLLFSRLTSVSCWKQTR